MHWHAFFAFTIIATIIFVLASFYPARLYANTTFSSMVADIMPDYEITEAIVGGEYVLAKTFAVETYPQISLRDSVRDQIAKFLASRQEVGLRPVRLLFRSPPDTPEEYWAVDFAGCAPGNCKTQSNAHSFEKIDKKVWLAHAASSPQTTTVSKEILRHTVDKIEYTAWLNLRYNGVGEIVTHELYILYIPRSRIKRFLGQLTTGGGRPVVKQTLSVRNFALDLSK